MKTVKKHINRIRKQTLDLLKQEIFAVVAVAVFCLVLVVWFNNSTQQTANNPNTSPQIASIAPSGSVVAEWFNYIAQHMPITDEGPVIAGESYTSSLGIPLRADSPFIFFGAEIKGLNRTGIETWQTISGVKNHGTHLEMLEDTYVTINGIHNGQFDIWIKGVGRMTINGIGVNIWTINTIKRTINITNNTLDIEFTKNAKIYSIATLAPEGDIPVLPELFQTPDKISLFPSISTINLQPSTVTIFKPVAITTDTTGKQIPNTSGLINWESSNNSIASVGSTGIVTVKTIGTVNITATVTGTTISSTAILTIQASQVSPLIDITPKPPITTATATATISDPQETSDNWQVTTSITDWLLNLFK